MPFFSLSDDPKRNPSKKKQTTTAAATLPLFFKQKELSLERDDDTSDTLHDVRQFEHGSSTWMVKDINANGRERYESLSKEIKSLLLNAEMMHSELYNFISGISGPHYRVIIDDEDGDRVVGLASQKVIKVHDFVDWLQQADLSQPESQLKLRQYFQLLTSQMMIEDPDPNPYNVMVTESGLVKIDEGWASYQLLLSLMQRPNVFSHNKHSIDDIKSVGKDALIESLGDYPVGELLKTFLPQFLTAMGYWFVQRQLVFEACRPFFAMDFKTLQAWLLSQQSDDNWLFEMLIAPTLVFHFVKEKCHKLFSKKDLHKLQQQCHEKIEKGLTKLLDMVTASLSNWLEKALFKTGLLALPTAENIESEAFSKVLFAFADALIAKTEAQIAEARQSVAKVYDLTLQFHTMRHMETAIRLLPWMDTLSAHTKLLFSEQLSNDYYLTATQYILVDSRLIERAALLSKMPVDKAMLFINYHQQRQRQYKQQLSTDPHYRLFLIKKTKKIKHELKQRVRLFQKDNPFYNDIDLLKLFHKHFDEWHQQLSIGHKLVEKALCHLKPG